MHHRVWVTMTVWVQAVIDRPLTLVNTPWPFTSKIQLSLISGISLFFAHKVLLKTIPLYKVSIGKRRWGMLLVEYYNTIFTKLIPPWAAMRQGRLNHHARSLQYSRRRPFYKSWKENSKGSSSDWAFSEPSRFATYGNLSITAARGSSLTTICRSE